MPFIAVCPSFLHKEFSGFVLVMLLFVSIWICTSNITRYFLDFAFSLLCCHCRAIRWVEWVCRVYLFLQCFEFFLVLVEGIVMMQSICALSFQFGWWNVDVLVCVCLLIVTVVCLKNCLSFFMAVFHFLVSEALKSLQVWRCGFACMWLQFLS